MEIKALLITLILISQAYAAETKFILKQTDEEFESANSQSVTNERIEKLKQDITDSPVVRFQQYTLKKGDTVSEVLQVKGADPLYGQDKFVEKALKLNRLTWEQAKELKQGDIILLPLADISTNTQVITKTIILDESPKGSFLDGEAFLTYSYRNSNIDFGENVKLDSSLYNNVGLKLQTELNRFINLYDVQLSGFLGAEVEQVNNAREIDENGGTVDYSMSYNVSGGVYVDMYNLDIRPFLKWEYENFDTSDLIYNDATLRQNEISWIGLGFKYKFNFSGFNIQVQPSVNYSVVTASELSEVGKISGLQGFKTTLDTKIEVLDRWVIGLDLDYYNFDEYSQYSISRVGLNIGRKI